MARALKPILVIFGLPGAFTPTCSAQHVPSYVASHGALKSAGVDEIWCVSVNDAFVMGAWGEMLAALSKLEGRAQRRMLLSVANRRLVATTFQLLDQRFGLRADGFEHLALANGPQSGDQAIHHHATQYRLAVRQRARVCRERVRGGEGKLAPGSSYRTRWGASRPEFDRCVSTARHGNVIRHELGAIAYRGGGVNAVRQVFEDGLAAVVGLCPGDRYAARVAKLHLRGRVNVCEN